MFQICEMVAKDGLVETLECRLHDLSSNPGSHKGPGKPIPESFLWPPHMSTIPPVPSHTHALSRAYAHTQIIFLAVM